jgi:gliding motility-associated-like protein
MRNITLLLFLLIVCTKVFSQFEWTWMSGDNTINASGIYGTKGVPSVNNKPGARVGSFSWADNAGNFWLFGGHDKAFSYFNDLWKFNPTTGEWTWMKGENVPNSLGVYGAKGIASITNEPRSRSDGVAWTDTNSDFWIFGGANMNDVWKYDLATNVWTWMHGDNPGNNNSAIFGVYGTKGVFSPTNKPSGRDYLAGWTDTNGKFWIFGGYGFASSYSTSIELNDLWTYDPSINQWKWVSGDSVAGVKSVYGTKGASSPNNKPGHRHLHHGWYDGNGNMWVFGGATEVNNVYQYLNDLWKYDPVADQWTWMSGESFINSPGSYGQKGIITSSNTPGARSSGVTFADNAGKIWLFGGQRMGSQNFNDLWSYDVITNQWTWMNGESFANSPGNYGQQGVASFNNEPGARFASCGSKDASGNCWIFGGYSLTNNGYLNDLWKLSLCKMPADSILPSSANFCEGSTVKLSLKPGYTYQWYKDSAAIPGATTNVYTASAAGKYTADIIAAGGCKAKTLNVSTVTIDKKPTLSISSSATSICSNTLVTFNAIVQDAGTFPKYQWKKNNQNAGTNLPAYSDENLAEGNSIVCVVTPNTACVANEIKSNSIVIRVTTSIPKPVNLGNDTVICNSKELVLNAYNTSYINYLWQDGSIDSAYAVNKSGRYSVQVKDACNRSFSDTIIITFQAPVNFDIGPDISICKKDSISLNAPAGFINYQWSPAINILKNNEATAVVFPSLPITYFVEAQTASGCPVNDSIHINLRSINAIYLGSDTSFCKGDSLILTAGEGFSNYLWSTGFAQQKLIVHKEGMYNIKALNQNGCYSYDTLVILKLNNLPIVKLNKDSFLCINTSRALDAGTGYISYLWNTGSTTQKITANNIGNYSVAVIDKNGCKGNDAVTINRFLPLPSGFLAGDRYICNYGTILLKSLSNFASYLWSTGEQTELIEIKKPGMYNLQVTDNFGCKGKETIQVVEKQCIEGFFIPNAFSPNNDGKNDIFKPCLFGNVLCYTFIIYNRWGQKVFETNDIKKGWDGKQNQSDKESNSFIWICNYQLAGQEKKIEKGTVVLIR